MRSLVAVIAPLGDGHGDIISVHKLSKSAFGRIDSGRHMKVPGSDKWEVRLLRVSHRPGERIEIGHLTKLDGDDLIERGYKITNAPCLKEEK